MFDFLGAIFSIIKKVFKSIFKFIKKLIQFALPIILIVAAVMTVWGSGMLTSLLAALPSSLGTFVSTLFTNIGTLWSAIKPTIGTVFSTAWGWFSKQKFTTQAMIVGAAAALLAPEETGELVVGAVETLGSVGSAILDSVTSSPVLWWALAGFLGYKLLTSDSKRVVVVGGSTRQ